ncbi:hypothetical protein BpHYR1_016520 [Brachionus plicatilis]|uniref:Uncharacterized protein n=1 Tax=Brachionus plicatilis TaxID=10195 RepID=A0A3M7R8C4_BRAPC|nr:hypothetical protein BpHYR1_016520 [Brachionus plicatilis]
MLNYKQICLMHKKLSLILNNIKKYEAYLMEICIGINMKVPLFFDNRLLCKKTFYLKIPDKKIIISKLETWSIVQFI